MKKLYISLILSISLPLSIFSQKKANDANLVGDVQCNGEHVPYVSVVLEGTTLGTTTDATGHYQIPNIPEGTYTVRVSGMGYKAVSEEFTAVENKTQEIKFEVEEDVHNLEEVVVSADRNQTNRKEAPIVVTSISPKLLEQTQSLNLADGLNFTPGLRTEHNCSNCGFTQLRMNGLDGPYTQVLMNSRPVFSGLAGVYGLELIPSNMVERLEVVRGGGSALFGGNAIAGTVNIITKEPTRNTFSLDSRYSFIGVGPHFDEDHEATPPAGDGQLNFNASVVTDDDKSGAYVYSMLRDKETHDENGDGYSESVLLNNTTFGFSAYHKPSAKSKITLDGYRINEFRRGGNKFDRLPHDADIAEQVEHTVLGGNLAFDKYFENNYNKLTLYAAAQKVDRNSYYGAEQDTNAYGLTNDLTTVAGIQYVMNSDNMIFAPASTIFGIDNNSNLIVDKKLGLDNSGITITDQLVNTSGAFVQNDWKTNRFNVAIGLRYDNYIVKDMHGEAESRAADVAKGVLVPRLSVLYKMSPSVRIRAGYAKGYRAPQVFNEDLHIEMINAKRVTHRNDPDLTQETSHSYTLSLNSNFALGNTANNFLIEGFYTRLDDAFADTFSPIVDEDTQEETGEWEYLRVNAEDGALVYGVNFEYGTYFSKYINMNMGFTVQKSRYENAQDWGDVERFPDHKTVHFLRSPDLYGYATLHSKITEKFEASLTFQYTGSMYVPHMGLPIYSQEELDALSVDPEAQDEYNEALQTNAEFSPIIESGDVIKNERLEKTEDFFVFDLLLSYTFSLTKETKLQVYAGAKNILNQTQLHHDSGKYRDAAYVYGPCKPRTFNIGIKLSNF